MFYPFLTPSFLSHSSLLSHSPLSHSLFFPFITSIPSFIPSVSLPIRFSLFHHFYPIFHPFPVHFSNAFALHPYFCHITHRIRYFTSCPHHSYLSSVYPSPVSLVFNSFLSIYPPLRSCYAFLTPAPFSFPFLASNVSSFCPVFCSINLFHPSYLFLFLHFGFLHLLLSRLVPLYFPTPSLALSFICFPPAVFSILPLTHSLSTPSLLSPLRPL